MPVEEIAGGAFRILFRVIIDTVYYVLGEIVCYYIGFATFRVLTIGRYPPREDSGVAELICIVVGFAEIVAAAIAIVRLTTP